MPPRKKEIGKIISFLKKLALAKPMDTVTIPRSEFETMKQELETLRSSHVYQRLLEFEEQMSQGKKYSRKELGF